MSWAVWITGPPASGKTVIARRAVELLRESGQPVVTVELDALRRVLTPEPTYSAPEREVVYRTLVYLARVLTEVGIPVIVDATAHRRAWRDLARASIRAFAEVQLVCPLPVLRKREATRSGTHAPPGIYAAAGQPGATVPGVDVAYEEALAPELRIDTSVEDVERAAQAVAALARDLARTARPRGGAVSTTAWAIWLTGLPGSGKTTLACHVAERLSTRGIGVRILDLTDLEDFVLAGGHRTEAEMEVAHRALVAVAQILTAVGVPVIIDATAPRRSWRDLARQLIELFAEVQLRCPPELCGDRERAVRWDLVLCGPATARRPARDRGPEIVLHYEEAIRPDLTIDTSAQSPVIAAEAVLRLAERLHEAALARRLRGEDRPCSSATS